MRPPLEIALSVLFHSGRRPRVARKRVGESARLRQCGVGKQQQQSYGGKEGRLGREHCNHHGVAGGTPSPVTIGHHFAAFTSWRAGLTWPAAAAPES